MVSARSESSARCVLLLDEDPAYGYCAHLSASAPQLRVLPLSASDAGTRQGCDVWFGAPDKAAALLQRGEKPDWLQLTWAGFGPLLKPGLPQDYLLTRAVDIFGQPMLEYVLAHLLSHAQRIPAYQAQQQRFTWAPIQADSLKGQRVMLVGVGNIGRYMATRLKCLGMDVAGVQRSPGVYEDLADTYDLRTFREHLDDVDVVINILPDTPETRNLFDLSLFRRMKPGALFMNIGRGSAVVDADLVTALEEGALRAAVLDVFRQEPLPPSHQFWIAPNLTLTPHIAGPVDPVSMVSRFLHNLKRFTSGQPLAGAVDLSRGY